MLDEFCQGYGYDRQYAIQLLGGTLPPPSSGRKLLMPLTATLPRPQGDRASTMNHETTP